MIKFSLEIWQKKLIIKRTADILEKLAVGSFLIGLFQDTAWAIIIGIIFMIDSFFLSCKGEKL